MSFGGQSEVGPLRRLFLKHPNDAFVSAESIEAQWKELGYLRKPDLSRATDEHAALREFLEGMGAVVDLLPADPNTGMDSIYVRDAALMTNRGAILCNMGKAARAGEADAQALCERRKPSDAVRPVEERGRAGDEDVEAREPTAVQVVDQLAQGFEALVAGVGPDALDRLHLVEDQQKPWPAALLEDRQQASEEAERSRVVHVALDARISLDARRHVRLTHEPRDQALGDRVVLTELRSIVGAQDSGVLWLHGAHLREARLH